MRSQSMSFKERAREKLADTGLRANLAKARTKFVGARAKAITAYEQDALGDFEALRARGEAIRNEVLTDLDIWLSIFEQKARTMGTEVIFARNAEEARQAVVAIGKRHGVTKAVKSKSMVSEETALNAALRQAGIEPVETDLGEYILQINNNEPPSHIIAPAVHKSKEEVARLFHKTHGTPLKTDIHELAQEARAVLRAHFLSASMGISGANFLVAETGSAVILTNEGNGRMVTNLPDVHVVITGIEKVVPTLEDLAVLLRLLPRSATGQPISNYVSMLTGRRGEAETEGARHSYIVLVDGERGALLGTDFQPMLRCIRCGACMNHCPVYQSVGGHAYGSVYPGPMGSVLTPLYTGITQAMELPHAATLCNQCGVVCPVRIPLPALLRGLRETQVTQALRPFSERVSWHLWAFLARHPKLYAFVVKIGVRYLNWLSEGKDRIRLLGIAPEWTLGRDFPAPQGRSFREMMRDKDAP
jgi:L-lactate dehydrogenase complex protein LldF